MTPLAPPSPLTSPAPPVLTVVGIGADGWDGLAPASRDALRTAGVLLGGARQLDLLPPECAGERVTWPSPLRPAVPGLIAAHAGRGLTVLASGDPMFHGIGRTLTEVLAALPDAPGAPRPRLRVLPHPSSVAYACARLGWPVADTEVVSVVGRPVAGLARVLHHGRRVLVLSSGADTPAQIAEVLRERGFGPSRMRVLEQLGGPAEARTEGTAASWARPPGDPLNVVAVECVRAPGALRLPVVPGLPDEAYEHDGQLTKRQVRAVTLAALAPEPGELLWDIGGGSGSVAIEWLRAHPACRAVTVERDAVRAARIARNAETLGVPALRVVQGAAPAALAGLPVPDAVFIGGGLTAPGLLDACWAALPPGGRLVANTVTLESEALLTEWYRRHGGDLVRLAVARAVPVGGFTGWRQAMPVTQWAAVKPAHPGDDVSAALPGEAGSGAAPGETTLGETAGSAPPGEATPASPGAVAPTPTSPENEER
ncbi:bifunctional cobalt-precorrin-7 (C(5))-methyltransferase/cobalt-precorrin-6B (C(15))-methyltransferase [Streptomyces catenulae]|uniref:Bifunctional cobalt-precorrin-7 (C(5))-methyltransferase/cobalt-precorrin-6B (C(15))-methyltransferase n=1 Tax=Streptomyces catenulae TaxID=66875 RepID=A0ABV2YXE3_9ACTN|nr:bifunctional cobalt-precorrin-7 (C(5))-methyltransferase/cobalt-precorrin-6B (C(15))-methyltransferase [Streptomyces catenulae]